MTNGANILGVAQGDSILEACWAHYAMTLPPELTDKEFRRAQEAFVGGARALYELLTRLQELADQRGDGPLDIARVGQVLGLNEITTLNG